MRVVPLFLILVLATLFVPVSAQAQMPQTLDNAVRDGARYLQSRFPRGTRAAIVAVQGENREIGEFVVRKLGEVLVNANWFTIVERDAAALATIERETDRHMNFYVSQETEIFIGRQLGAEVIISGSMTRIGANWRLDVHAVTVFCEQLPASPPTNTALLRVEATIAFSQAGPYHITEMTEAMAMRRVAERIANEGPFSTG